MLVGRPRRRLLSLSGLTDPTPQQNSEENPTIHPPAPHPSSAIGYRTRPAPLARAPTPLSAVDTISRNDPAPQPDPGPPVARGDASPHPMSLDQPPSPPFRSPIQPYKTSPYGAIPQFPNSLPRPGNWDTMTQQQRRSWRKHHNR